jgi:uncharacterized OB-fold protein
MNTSSTVVAPSGDSSAPGAHNPPVFTDGRPVPTPDADSRPYWEAANRGEFLFQRCTACGKPQFYARALCRYCHGRELTWERAAGGGRVASFTLVSRAPSDAFARLGPYVIALIDLDEGVRFLCNVIDSPLEAVQIGARIRLVFETREGSAQKIPQATLVGLDPSSVG